MLWITNFHFSTECRDVSNLRRQAAGQRRPIRSLLAALPSIAGRGAARRGNVVLLGISASARGRGQRAMVAPSPAGRRRHVRQRSLPVRLRGRQCSRARLRAHRWDQARTSQCPCGSCPLESHPPQRARSAILDRQLPGGSCRGSDTSASTATPTAGCRRPTSWQTSQPCDGCALPPSRAAVALVVSASRFREILSCSTDKPLPDRQVLRAAQHVVDRIDHSHGPVHARVVHRVPRRGAAARLPETALKKRWGQSIHMPRRASRSRSPACASSACST